MRPHVVHWLDGLVPGSVASALAPTWFTCVGLAGVIALLAMLAIARRHRIDPGAVASVVLWCYVAAVAAGIAIPSAIDAAEQLLTTGRAQIRWAGMTSFWGYLAGGCAVAAVCRAHRVPVRRFADLAAAPLGVALMLARLGCFLAGCDYGKVSSLPWAVRFPAHSPAWQDHVAAGLVSADRPGSLPVHPTQLYEAALGLAIAALALVVGRRRRQHTEARDDGRGDGRVFVLAAAVYAIGRIAIEDLRGDAGRGIYLGLSSGQIFSLLLLAVLAAGHRLRRIRPTAATATATATAAGLALGLALTAPDARAQSAPAPASRTGTGSPATPPAASPPDPPFGPQLPPPQQQPQQPPAPLYAPSGPPAPPAPRGKASVSAGPPAPGSAGGASISAGALVGAAAAFNRRRDQIGSLTGASISIGFAVGATSRQLGVWVDLDSFANRDATHGTALLSAGALFEIGSHLWIGGRVGIGATLVNFHDPAFRDVAGITGRAEALVDYHLGESWVLSLRPLALDVLSAADLGGPIATWQARIGLAYHFGVGHRAAPAAAAAAAATMAPAATPAPAAAPVRVATPAPVAAPAPAAIPVSSLTPALGSPAGPPRSR